jgi:putative membrane protein
VAPRLIQAATEQAVGVFDQQAARARKARKLQSSEQWLAQLPPTALPAPPSTHAIQHASTQEEPDHG